MPTNIGFILKLANHGAFENGDVETNFIELHKNDLFANQNDSLSIEKAHNASNHGATVAAACICQQELAAMRESISGKLTSHFFLPRTIYVSGIKFCNHARQGCNMVC